MLPCRIDSYSMCERRPCQLTLAVLLPASSVGCSGHTAHEHYAQQICKSILQFLESNPAVKMVCGMDDLDPARPLMFGAINRHCAVHAKKVTLHKFKTADLTNAVARSSSLSNPHMTKSDTATAPICWMWGELALLAVRNHRVDLCILLGDDTEISPKSWAYLVTGQGSFRTEQLQMPCITCF